MIDLHRKIGLLWRGITNPHRAVRFVAHYYVRGTLNDFNLRYKLTEAAKVRDCGERIVLKDFQAARNSHDFCTLAHIQRYEWVLPFLTGLDCLDVGCGSGYGTSFLADNGLSTIIGIDSSTKAIDFAKIHYKARNRQFMRMDALKLNFEDGRFNAVISFDVLEHVPGKSQGKFVSEIERVLQDRGVAYIGSPNAAVMQNQNPFHEKELAKDEFESLLTKRFSSVEVFGQDITLGGVRCKEKWYDAVAKTANLTAVNLTLSKEDVERCFGLLAICRKQ